MTRLLAVALLAACTTTPEPDPSTVKPDVSVGASETSMLLVVGFENDSKLADVDVAFRGHTLHLGLPPPEYQAVNLTVALDHPLEKDEPIVFTIDGIALTVAAPPPFDFGDIPQFISRSGSATIDWTMTSGDPIYWSTLHSSCTLGGGQLAPNATSVTFTPDSWHAVTPPPPTATCTTDIQLTRDRFGTIAAPFAGGQVEATQNADIVFASMP